MPSEVVPMLTVKDTARTCRQDLPPRYVGGGAGEIQGEQLVPQLWLPPCQEGGLQPFVRVRLPCFSRPVQKPIGCNFQAVFGTGVKGDG